MSDDDRYERGRARFLEVHDEKALRAVEGLGDVGRSILEFVYGTSTSDPASPSAIVSSPQSPRSSRSAAPRRSPSTCGQR
jgi:hypothetical protein